MLRTLLLLTMLLTFHGVAQSQSAGSAYIFAEIVMPTTIQFSTTGSNQGTQDDKVTGQASSAKRRSSPKTEAPATRPATAFIVSGEPYYAFTVSLSTVPVNINSATCKMNVNKLGMDHSRRPMPNTDTQAIQIMPEGTMVLPGVLPGSNNHLWSTPYFLTVNYN